jgi:hypothetical protein
MHTCVHAYTYTYLLYIRTCTFIYSICFYIPQTYTDIGCIHNAFTCTSQYSHSYIHMYRTTYTQYTHIHKTKCVNTRTYIYTHSYRHACMHPYIHTYIRTHARTHAHTYIHTHARLFWKNTTIPVREQGNNPTNHGCRPHVPDSLSCMLLNSPTHVFLISESDYRIFFINCDLSNRGQKTVIQQRYTLTVIHPIIQSSFKALLSQHLPEGTE